jgi:hypothetical protein
LAIRFAAQTRLSGADPAFGIKSACVGVAVGYSGLLCWQPMGSAERPGYTPHRSAIKPA